MQSSDLTKFRFAANIAGPYCSACCSGGGGSAGPTGPTGPTGPSGGGTPTTWAQYPAIQNVDLSCNLINDVSAINFCDGTYIGPGGSFDISSNDTIKILTGATKDIELLPGSGKSTITSSGDTAVLQLNAVGGANGTITADDNDGELKIIAENSYGLNMRGGIVNLGTNIPSGTATIGVNNDATNILLEPSGGNGIITIETEGDGTANITSRTVYIGDNKNNGNGTVLSLADATQVVKLTNSNGADVIMRLENQGGKGGEVFASETGGFMAVQAQAGYNLLMESTGGSVNIATANPDTTLTASVNGGTAQITLTDTAGVGDVVLSAGSVVNTLKQTATATEITGDNSTGAPAIIQFTDPNLGPAQLAYIPDSVVFTNNEIQATSAFLGVSSGAVEGVSIGSDFLTNYVVGKGLPLIIAQDMTNRPTNYISINNGDTAVVASNTVSLGLGASPSILADANNSKLLIDSATGSAGLQYDGASATPVQFHFNSADFISGSAGGNTGQYLRIFINGTEYKIALLAP